MGGKEACCALWALTFEMLRKWSSKERRGQRDGGAGETGTLRGAAFKSTGLDRITQREVGRRNSVPSREGGGEVEKAARQMGEARIGGVRRPEGESLPGRAICC